MTTACRHGLFVAAFTLAACHPDSTGVPPETLAIAPLASLAAEDAPRYSDWSTPVNLGAPVNTSFIDQGADISRDGLSLYYFCGNCPDTFGNADLWVAHRASIDAPWGTPQRLGANVNSPANETAPRLSIDGHRLYFTSDRNGGFGGTDIYVSRRRDKRDDQGWEPAVNLGSGVNTSAGDAQPAPFEDEATGTTLLYFASNRAGGPGMNDIYVSTLQPDGTFGPATIVAELNTPFQDQQPAIRRDGLEMFLGSDRTGTVGSIDLWVSTRASTTDPWSPPVNLGPVVNSTVQDGRPALSFDGTQLYFQSPRTGGLGSFDLYVTTRTKLTGPN